jgi:hypothetical protein
MLSRQNKWKICAYPAHKNQVIQSEAWNFCDTLMHSCVELAFAPRLAAAMVSNDSFRLFLSLPISEEDKIFTR